MSEGATEHVESDLLQASADTRTLVLIDDGSRRGWVAEFASVFADYAESQGHAPHIVRVRPWDGLEVAEVVDLRVSSLVGWQFSHQDLGAIGQALSTQGLARGSVLLCGVVGGGAQLCIALRDMLNTIAPGEVEPRAVAVLGQAVEESFGSSDPAWWESFDGLLLHQPVAELLELLGPLEATRERQLKCRRLSEWMRWPAGSVAGGPSSYECARHALGYCLDGDAPHAAVALLREFDFVVKASHFGGARSLRGGLARLIDRWGAELGPETLTGLEQLERALLGCVFEPGAHFIELWNAMYSECGAVERMRTWFARLPDPWVKLRHPVAGRSLAQRVAMARAPCVALACSEGGQLACGGGGSLLRVWLDRPVDGQFDSREVSALLWTRHGLVSGGDGVRLWPHASDDGGYSVSRMLGGSSRGQVRALAHIRRQLLVGYEDGVVETWSLDHERLLAQQRVVEGSGENEAVEFIVELGEGSVAVGDGTYVYLCEAELPPERYQHAGCVTAMVSLPELGVAACGDHTGALYLWDYRRDAVGLRFGGHAGRVNALVVNEQGLLVSGSDDRSVRVWDPRSGALLADLHGHADAVTALALAPRGELISASSEGSINAWRPRRRRDAAPYLGASVVGHRGPVTGLAWIDEHTVVSAALDGTLCTWDLPSAELRSLRSSADSDELRVELLGLARSPRGRLVAPSPHAGIRVYAFANGELHGVGPPLVAADGGSFMTGFCLGPDELVVASDLHGMLRVWELDTGAQILSLEGNGKPLVGHVLTSEGTIATASAHSLWIWDPRSGEILARADQLDAQPRHIAAGSEGSVIVIDEYGALYGWRPEAGVTEFSHEMARGWTGCSSLSAAQPGHALIAQGTALWRVELREGGGRQRLCRGQSGFTSVLCRGRDVIAGDGLGNLWFLDADWSRGPHTESDLDLEEFGFL